MFLQQVIVLMISCMIINVFTDSMEMRWEFVFIKLGIVMISLFIFWYLGFTKNY